MPNECVLVTGGSGFVGGHCALQLLAAGYLVRTTVRSLEREAGVRETLQTGGAATLENLSFAAAELTTDEGWTEAISGCDFVLHVASPLSSSQNEDELIVPAREGTLRVLRAARDEGVRRVVLTSSFGAVGYGPIPPRPFTEEDWTSPEDNISPYVKSKVLAERAAWDFMAREGGALELAVINPGAIFGPALSAEAAGSLEVIQRLLEGRVPGLLDLTWGVVDVRDIADLHLRAMTHPGAAGERFIGIADRFMSMREIALTLKGCLGDAASRVPTRVLPNWLVRLLARFNPAVRTLVPALGKVKDASNEKARRVLGWTPRPSEEVLVATAESLMRLGLVRGPS